jgi:sulfate/thiosulfate transport system substrate-binding protein
MPLDRILSWTDLTLAFLFVLAVVIAGGHARAAEPDLVNASYDVSRELYKDVNDAFIADWKKKTGETATINQSHGGSTKQALAVANGLEADVVTFNQSPDVDFLVKNGAIVAANWRERFPNGASPYTTTSIFLVRKGNPKGIKDWDDLAKPGIKVVVPNPKTSGNGRYTYLAAWGYALRKSGSEDRAREFVRKLFANVPVFDGGGRGATTTFTQRDTGDVLVTFENEAADIGAEFGAEFEIVYPKLSIEAEPPVAVVDKYVDKHGTRKLAEAYLNFLYTPKGQTIIAKHNLRPRDEAVLKANTAKFPPVETFTVEKVFGGWDKVQKQHFADGGVYDQIAIGQ